MSLNKGDAGIYDSESNIELMDSYLCSILFLT